MDHEILEYCVSRKPKGELQPSWQKLADEIYDNFGVTVESVSGLRSRVAEYRKLAHYVPDFGVIQGSVPASETWGDGLARVVPMTTKEAFETYVWISDVHVPYHDAALLQAVAELVKDIDPHCLAFNGDWNDFFGLSRFNKSMDRLDKLQEELDLGYMARKLVCDAAPNARKRETLGNHEERLLTYMEVNAPSTKSLRVLRPENLLRLNELEIEHYPRQGFRIRENFVCEHGHIVKRDSSASAKARATDTLISGIMGHTHRMGSYFKTGYRAVQWHEQGCLCLRTPDYVVGETNWQPGIAVGMFSTKNPEVFNVQLVHAVGEGFIFDGKVYGNVESEVPVYAAA